MKTKIITPDQYLEMPWKNGGGSTLEIYIQKSADEIKWRLSIATIESSGPFSVFPDHHRIILPLDGNGIILTHENSKPVILPALVPYLFDGSALTQCKLQGPPTRDFNVMTHIGYGSSKVEVLHSSKVFETHLNSLMIVAIFALKGSTYVRTRAFDIHELTIKQNHTWIGEGSDESSVPIEIVAEPLGTAIVCIFEGG